VWVKTADEILASIARVLPANLGSRTLRWCDTTVAPLPSMHTTTHARTCRVAICDDVAEFRELLTLMLTRAHDLQVVGEASNGIEAIELVRAQAPDVLLLDVAMPVMDGLAALPKVREVSPNTRVILLTGFASERVRQEATQAGVALCLEKGARPDLVVEAIRSVCKP
jgi:DNA-binding NarL/FixJ family response regulator